MYIDVSHVFDAPGKWDSNKIATKKHTTTRPPSTPPPSSTAGYALTPAWINDYTSLASAVCAHLATVPVLCTPFSASFFGFSLKTFTDRIVLLLIAKEVQLPARVERRQDPPHDRATRHEPR